MASDRSDSSSVGGCWDRHAIRPADPYAILVLVPFGHVVDKPDAATNDERQHQEGEQVHEHPVRVVVLLGPAGIFAEIADRRAPPILQPYLGVPGTRPARLERKDTVALFVFRRLLRHQRPLSDGSVPYRDQIKLSPSLLLHTRFGFSAGPARSKSHARPAQNGLMVSGHDEASA